MSGIHYFQRYSQAENVVTNNTLLLFSRLYHHSPLVFQAFLSGVLDDTEVSVGPTFRQQEKAGLGSIPDGSISQSSFKVVIETKLSQNYDSGQLLRHIQAFGTEQDQILLHLSPNEPDASFITMVKAELAKSSNGSVRFVPTTFRTLIENARKALPDHVSQMQELVDDFEGFCSTMGLLPTDVYRMRVVTCGDSLDENFRYNLYYHPAARGYQNHAYLGVYARKSVRGIGKIKNVVEVDYLDGEWRINRSTVNLGDQDKHDILGAMREAKQNRGWKIWTGHVFFLVDTLYATDFKKTSSGGLLGTRIFDLRDVLDVQELPPTGEIADKLRTVSWA